jgi:hypothetical protein
VNPHIALVYSAVVDRGGRAHIIGKNTRIPEVRFLPTAFVVLLNFCWLFFNSMDGTGREGVPCMGEDGVDGQDKTAGAEVQYM